MELKELVNYTRQLLQVERYADYCPNGLQVEGKPLVSKIVSGVTASMAFLEAAKDAGADAVLVHHGYFWKNEEAEIFLDTSGDSLARHGYRKLPGKAPMLEALASATILSTKWNKFGAFVNPMCGSGTLAIEAALIATKRAPGLLRSNYAFMHLLGYDKAVYEKELTIIEEQVRHLPNLTIIASDISRDAIKIAKINAAVAGVEDLIDFQVCDFEATDMPEPEQGAVVMINPEYGERLGEELELEATYARMGDYMKNKCKGMTGYIFTGNLELAKKIRLKPSRRIEFLNAKIDCRLLEYELYAGTKRTDKMTEVPKAPNT